MANKRSERADADILSMAAEKASPTKSMDNSVNTPQSPQSQSLDSTDEFYDAVDTPEASAKASPNNTSISTNGEAESDVPVEIEEEMPIERKSGLADITVSNRRIIAHILSQLHVGMDLTRFTLPAFLIAPHSLLQMYADLFARPHMLTSVTDFEDPKDRMIAVVKWFMGAISASRKDPAVKKPYNPVLGETFRCFWNVPGVPSNKEPDFTQRVLADTGPFPEGGHEAFSLVAEQVSHHPPISAFYAECPAKQMYINVTVCSKTKLTPSLSVKAHNTGLFRLCLIDRGEEYTTALPHGYVRGVLTTPWFEFGGECNVDCAQTGHTATLVFHPKPFTGGKRHRVTAKLKHKSDAKPYATFEGEWDNLVYFKTPDTRPEVCLDASSPTILKKMRTPACADKTDSRIVWSDLTQAIHDDDSRRAADSKHKVEEHQRELARERIKTGDVFVPKHFHQAKDNPDIWEYNTPLDERLSSLH